MLTKHITRLTWLLLFTCAAQAQTNTSQRKVEQASPVNPVIDSDFADPTVIRAPDGHYYAYATQATINGKAVNIQVATSTDKMNWKVLGDALPQKPAWAGNTYNFWAPHVLYDSLLRQYVMYFSSGNSDTSIGKCIGVAFAAKPTGPFVDKGSALICGEGFVNIDPMAFVDPANGKKLLYWGSGFQPIKVRELTSDWKEFAPGSSSIDLLWPGKEKQYTNLLEGAWLDYQDSLYYLYYSGDNCCGEKANYALMVSRSKSATGPFECLGLTVPTASSVILEQDKRWLAPGHHSIFADEKGNKWLAYHAIDRRRIVGHNGYGRRVMLIKSMRYENGWPVIAKEK